MKGPSRARFAEIYDQGQRASRPLLSVRALPGTGQIGIAVSKSIGSHARRNRQRRRVRAALAEFEAELQGLDVTVTVRQAAETATSGEIAAELRELIAEMRSRWANGSASD